MKKKTLGIIVLCYVLFTGCQSTVFSGDYVSSSNYQTRKQYQVSETAYLGANLFFQGEISVTGGILRSSAQSIYYADSIQELAILIYYMYQEGITSFEFISKESYDADELYAHTLSIMPENTYLWLSELENPIYADYNYYYVVMNRLDESDESLVYQEIEKIIGDISDELTDREKVKKVHDYIILSAAYDEGAFNDMSDLDRAWNASSAYSILVEKTGMCTGYSKAFYLLMRELNIPSIVVAGDASGSHAWNLVYLDNEWYQIDLTWNDPIPDRKGVVRYTYFLKPIKSGNLAGHLYNTKYDGSLTLESYLEFIDVLFPSLNHLDEDTKSN